jgi:hypothetical protein
MGLLLVSLLRHRMKDSFKPMYIMFRSCEHRATDLTKAVKFALKQALFAGSDAAAYLER